MMIIILSIIFLVLLFGWPVWLVGKIEADYEHFKNMMKSEIEILELKINNRLASSHEQCDKKIYQVADRLYTKLKQMGRMN